MKSKEWGREEREEGEEREDVPLVSVLESVIVAVLEGSVAVVVVDEPPAETVVVTVTVAWLDVALPEEEGGETGGIPARTALGLIIGRKG